MKKMIDFVLNLIYIQTFGLANFINCFVAFTTKINFIF